jgi:hypothetical protein
VCGQSTVDRLCELAQAKVDELCKENCPDTPTCEKNCEGKSQCASGPCPQDPPAADSGKVINVTGCIEGEGEHCLLYDECDADEEDPKCCPPVECNCHSECESGQICSDTTGTCVDLSNPAP